MSERRAPGRRWVWPAAGLLLVAALGALALWGRPVYDLVADPERVRAWVAGFGPWAPLAIVALEIVQVLLGPVPGQAIGAVSGYLYGPWLGTVYGMAGIVAGSLLAFTLTRRLGRPLLRRWLSPETLAALDALARRGGTLFFFLVWLLPLAPDDLACFAAALTPMSTGQFLLLMTVGRLPGVFASAWFGANVAKLSPIWWGILLAGLAVAAIAVWQWGSLARAAVLRLLGRLAGHQGG